MTRPEEGRQEDRRAVEHEVVEAARKPAPFCRDCADQVPLGRCEHTGKLCDPYQAALERLRGPTYEDGLREAAEIARGKAQSSRASAARAEMAGRNNVASHRYSDAETAEDIAEAIESKLTELTQKGTLC